MMGALSAGRPVVAIHVAPSHPAAASSTNRRRTRAIAVVTPTIIGQATYSPVRTQRVMRLIEAPADSCVPSMCPYENAPKGTVGHSRGEPSAPNAQPATAQPSVTASSAFARQASTEQQADLAAHCPTCPSVPPPRADVRKRTQTGGTALNQTVPPVSPRLPRGPQPPMFQPPPAGTETLEHVGVRPTGLQQQLQQQRRITRTYHAHLLTSATDGNDHQATVPRSEKRKVGGSRPPLTTRLTCGFSLGEPLTAPPRSVARASATSPSP